MDGRSGVERRTLRDARIVAAILAGQTQDVVAKQEGVSRRRVGQVVAAHPGVREEAQRCRREAHDAQRERVLEWSRSHPGVPLSRAVVELELSWDMVRATLGERAALHTGPVKLWSDEQVRDAVARFVATTNPPTVSAYRARARAQGWPSFGTVQARYGSWSEALRQVTEQSSQPGR